MLAGIYTGRPCEETMQNADSDGVQGLALLLHPPTRTGTICRIGSLGAATLVMTVAQHLLGCC